MERFELARAFDAAHAFMRNKGIEDDGEGEYAQVLRILAEAAERGAAENVIEQTKVCTSIRAWYDIRELLDDNRLEGLAVYEFVRDAVLFVMDCAALPEVGADAN